MTWSTGTIAMSQWLPRRQARECSRSCTAVHSGRGIIAAADRESHALLLGLVARHRD
jgi:hypothetical protein